MGGLPRRATFIDKVRRSGNPLLVFDTGGMFLKNPADVQINFPLLQVRSLFFIKALGRMGYDAVNLGRTDLALPAGMLAKLARQAAFPVLSANLRDETGTVPFTPFTIKKFGSFQVGIFGLVSERISPSPSPDKDGYRFLDPIETAREVVGELKKSCRLIVALTSLGLEEDARLAREVPGIDIILGGLTRKNMYRPRIEAAGRSGIQRQRRAGGLRGTLAPP